MTAAHLIESLAAELRETTAQVKLPVEYHTPKEGGEPTFEDCVPVNVFTQYLPQDLFENEHYYPCICAELIKISDDLKDGSSVEVAISAGVFAYEGNSWQDLFHLLEVCRERVLTSRVIANRFRLVNAEWGLIDSELQPRPFYFGQGIVTYQIYQPHEIGLPI